MTKKLWMSAAIAAAMFAAPAFAQVDATDVDGSRYAEPSERMGNFDVNLMAGAGTYLGGLSDHLGLGPTWGVRLDGPLTQGIGWELGYTGSRNPFTDERVEEGSAAWRNGINGMAKIYAPSQTFRPFAGVGIGASYINIGEGAEDVYNNDFVTEVPVAAGVEFVSQNGFNAGLRAGYSFMAGEELADNAEAGSPGGGLLSGNLTVGGRF